MPKTKAVSRGPVSYRVALSQIATAVRIECPDASPAQKAELAAARFRAAAAAGLIAFDFEVFS
jgi:hypothetical protein